MVLQNSERYNVFFHHQVFHFRGDHLVVINMQPTNADAEADLCIAKPIGQVLSEDIVVEE